MTRPATITTLSFAAHDAETVADTVDQAADCIALASCDRPDLIVLPEVFAAGNTQCQESVEGFCAAAEPLDGPIIGRMAACARQHECYIAAPVILEREQQRTNSIVFLDRRGEIAGVYDKMYPPFFELEQGRNIAPGNKPLVVETDFGRVGFVICFDLNFSDLRQHYILERPGLLVFPSMFQGGMLVSAWALLTGCYMISAFGGPGSLIVNPLGRVLGTSCVPNSEILTQRINMDFAVCHLDFNQRKLPELRRRFGADIEIEISEAEGHMLLTSIGTDRSVADICRELELETIQEFYTRYHTARHRALDTGPIPPGPPSW